METATKRLTDQPPTVPLSAYSTYILSEQFHLCHQYARIHVIITHNLPKKYNKYEKQVI